MSEKHYFVNQIYSIIESACFY